MTLESEGAKKVNRVRVIGLGQRAAGDDGVGHVVLDRLAEVGIPKRIEVLRILDASALIPLLASPVPVVLVDAVLGTPPGEVLELGPDDLNLASLLPISTHGLSVGEAIRLAGVLAPRESAPSIRIVAVTVARPDRYRVGLSPAVAAAVPLAAERVLGNCMGRGRLDGRGMPSVTGVRVPGSSKIQ